MQALASQTESRLNARVDGILDGVQSLQSTVAELQAGRDAAKKSAEAVGTLGAKVASLGQDIEALRARDKEAEAAVLQVRGDSVAIFEARLRLAAHLASFDVLIMFLSYLIHLRFVLCFFSYSFHVLLILVYLCMYYSPASPSVKVVYVKCIDRLHRACSIVAIYSTAAFSHCRFRLSAFSGRAFCVQLVARVAHGASTPAARTAGALRRHKGFTVSCSLCSKRRKRHRCWCWWRS